jgi:tyrosyl-tRNA synthetase
VASLARVFTFFSRAEILALAQATRDRPAALEGQRALAEMVHGAAACRRVRAAGQALFGRASSNAAEATAMESDLLHGRYLVPRRGKRAVGAVEAVRRHP